MLKLPNNTTGIISNDIDGDKGSFPASLSHCEHRILSATGQPLCRGLSPRVQVSLEVEVTEGSSFLLYDCPSVLGWMSGLGTDPMTDEQELSGKRVALS